MSEQRVLFLQKSLIGTCALLALILLVSFYSVVNAAVDRAARQRVASTESAQSVDRTAAPATQGASARGNALLARVGH
jgi:hypothetical protein